MTALSIELILRDEPESEARGPFPTERVAFDGEAWAKLPLQLEPGADEAYSRLATQGPFGGWWLSTSGGTLPGIRRFLLSTPPQHWPRPWELMIGALPPRLQHDVSIVRRVGEERLMAQRSEFDEPLRVLLVQGSPSAPGYAEIDIGKEEYQIQDAYAGLDMAARSTVSAPVAVKPGSQDFSDCLAAHRPHVLWFSGHGRSDPPGLLLADGTWMSPSDLAKAILDGAAKGAPIPLYVVMWACNSAVQSRFSAPGAAPPFIDTLGKIGVSAVLATQAPLADDVAPVLARAVFAGLAAGQPIDVAVTRARGAFLSNPERDVARLDWACPVVWCSDKPTEAIVWRDGREVAVLRQNALRRVSAPSEDPVLNEAGKAQARLWSAARRVWVEASLTTSHATKAEWEARAWSMPRDNRNTVILLDYSRDTVAGVLQDWAKSIIANVDQSDDPDRLLRTAADLATRDPEQAFAFLCARKDATLAIVAPQRDVPGWFWPAVGGAHAAVNMLGKGFVRPADEGWRVDRMTTDEEKMEPDTPELIAALAVLGAPVAEGDLKRVIEEEGAAHFQWERLVRTRDGYYLPLNLAAPVQDHLAADEAALRGAHRMAFRLLDGAVARARLREPTGEPLLWARYTHAHDGQMRDELLASAQALIHVLAHSGRSQSLIGVFETVSYDHRRMAPLTLLRAGFAYTQAGDPATATSWLNLIEAEDLAPIDNVRRLLFLAEAAKSSGDEHARERARGLLEEAYKASGAVEGDIGTRVGLEARHDLVRLRHYIDHEAEAAIPLYREVEDGWQQLPNSGLARAIVLRNLAEAEIAVGEEHLDEAERFLGDAETDLDTARTLLPLNCGHPVVGEIEYVSGRLAVRLGLGEEIKRRFLHCRAVALAINNMMLAAITDARLFWIAYDENTAGLQFDPSKWQAEADKLGLFARHGWAARVLINGYLRSAHISSDQGENRIALTAVRKAKALLDQNPDHDGGSDRRRIVALHAGLELFSKPNEAWWSRLRVQYPWAEDWISERNVKEPKQAWELAV